MMHWKSGAPATPKGSERQGQCPVSDIIDLDQCDLAVSVATFFSSGCPGNEFREAGRADDMTIEHLPYSADSPPNTIFESPERRTVASYERELTRHRHTEIRLREALAREEALLRQKDELIQQQEVLSKESDHRLLNGLQMIVSLLSLQSRASTNAEAASQLAAAADRMATIGRIHRRLHSFRWRTNRRVQAIPRGSLSRFLHDAVLGERPERVIVVEGIEIKLPAVTGHSARLHRQRADHERSQIRQRPDHGQIGTQSRKGLRAVGFQ